MVQLKDRLANRTSVIKRNGAQECHTKLIKDNEKGDVSVKLQSTSLKLSQQRQKDSSLVLILSCTALSFFLLHTPRILTSLYEALTIQSQQVCSEKGKEFLSLWFLYTMAAMSTCLVLNASSNLLIYLVAGQAFREKFKSIFCLKNGSK